jgi:hypothetical protein
MAELSTTALQQQLSHPASRVLHQAHENSRIPSWLHLPSIPAFSATVNAAIVEPPPGAAAAEASAAGTGGAGHSAIVEHSLRSMSYVAHTLPDDHINASVPSSTHRAVSHAQPTNDFVPGVASPMVLTLDSASSSSAEGLAVDSAASRRDGSDGDCGVHGVYGESMQGKAWRGLRPLAQTLEMADGIGSRRASSYALDVMAP